MGCKVRAEGPTRTEAQKLTEDDYGLDMAVSCRDWEVYSLRGYFARSRTR